MNPENIIEVGETNENNVILESMIKEDFIPRLPNEKQNESNGINDYAVLNTVSQSVISAHKMNVPVEKVSLKDSNSVVKEYNDANLNENPC